MKIEEAINILKYSNPNNIVCPDVNPLLYNKREEAFNMAIKALQKQIITCKDCVKGQREYSNSKKYCMWIGRITEDDFYCGYAVKKSEDEE